VNWPEWLSGPESFFLGLLFGGNLACAWLIARLDRVKR
jgi:hypothetical protein